MTSIAGLEFPFQEMCKQHLHPTANLSFVTSPQALDLLGKILTIEVGETSFAQQRALLGAPLDVVRFVGSEGPETINPVHEAHHAAIPRQSQNGTREPWTTEHRYLTLSRQGDGRDQNKKYLCAIGSTVAGSQVSNSPSARTS